MLEKQELDRANEFKNREQRAQHFMNKMADTVLKKMDVRQKDEDQKIKKYELEKELRDRLDDEKRQKKLRDNQDNMRVYLSKQMEEKKIRETMEKQLNAEQAAMWDLDQRNYHQEERRLNEKVNLINKENADFLKK